jgi:uncharacterized protein
MFEALKGIFWESWTLFVEASPYLLFGFLAAAVLKALIPEGSIARHLGKDTLGSVVKASLFGIPLPLCSCGVIPAAVELRRQGASKGASAAFLVSVPETGVDSIAITYALLDPIMTVIRPVAAFFTATVAGSLINRIPDPPAARAVIEGAHCADGCCGMPSAQEQRPPLGARIREGLRYAFGELLRDIGKWLLLGIAVAGVISWYVPDDFFASAPGGELTSMLLMLVIGIPLYVCASASTPVAAALVLKGLSPGAALIFLLAGPATNAATITIVGRFWGKKAAAVYLASIAGCSLILGWLTNRLYSWSGADITRWVSEARIAESSWAIAAAAVLLLLLARAHIPSKRKGGCGDGRGDG